ncbi:MAG: DNA repair protein RecO [Pirellulaceae bacterium]
MSSEKSIAIVLRIVDFSETSVVATLFTETHGKISALAKGARRPKGPFESALDLLSVCRIVFIHKRSDALDLLTEAKLERRFRSATRDLSRLYAGYYVVELLHDLTDTGDPHPDLFRVADQTLYALDHGEKVPSAVLRFELTTLRVLGLLPSLDRCVGCGTEVAKTRRVAFGQLAGGVLCAQCRPGQRQVVSVSADVLRAMRLFAAANGAGWQHAPLAPRVLGELRGVLNHYLANLLGHPPRMSKYLGTLTN